MKWDYAESPQEIWGRFSVIHKLLAYNNNTLQINGLGNLEIPNPFFLLGMFVFEQKSALRVASVA